MCLFAEEVERIPRVVTKKVERRYLRYLEAGLRDRFTINFEFQKLIVILICQYIAVLFQSVLCF